MNSSLLSFPKKASCIYKISEYRAVTFADFQYTKDER